MPMAMKLVIFLDVTPCVSLNVFDTAAKRMQKEFRSRNLMGRLFFLPGFGSVPTKCYGFVMSVLLYKFKNGRLNFL
jgi:hypothetical protein